MTRAEWLQSGPCVRYGRQLRNLRPTPAAEREERRAGALRAFWSFTRWLHSGRSLTTEERIAKANRPADLRAILQRYANP